VKYHGALAAFDTNCIISRNIEDFKNYFFLRNTNLRMKLENLFKISGLIINLLFNMESSKLIKYYSTEQMCVQAALY
jgi:hypothetical protein